MAASKKIPSAPRNAAAPHTVSDWMSPTKPESLSLLMRASSGRLRNTKASITTPSKMRSTMTVASEAETGTPSLRFRITARSTSPARAG